jgi:hypothetical protein
VAVVGVGLVAKAVAEQVQQHILTEATQLVGPGTQYCHGLGGRTHRRCCAVVVVVVVVVDVPQHELLGRRGWRQQ